MKRLTIHASRVYDVFVGNQILNDLGRYTSNLFPACKLCVITDSTVDDLYGATVTDSLQSAGYEICKFVFPAGEASKNMSTLNEILEFLGREQLTRSDAIVALGGGVTGDMAGFAAATYLRGIPFIQVPTTLLAAVDSSVGGKTGVNSSVGKNLIGAFWQPSLVFCDCKTFETLPRETYLDGIAEAVKYGVITDSQLFEQLQNHSISEEDMVVRCISIKSKLVEADERDTGSRQLLNFGHTIGHSIENASNYAISHGHAVAIGMLIASRAAFSMGLCSQNLCPAIKSLLLQYGFSLDCAFEAELLAKIALQDKKRQGSTITLVLPQELGDCRLAKLDVSLLPQFVSQGLLY